MARSAQAYVHGSTVQFYEWLEAQKQGTLPEGPPVWICGDCHAGNLGPVAGVDGRIAVQIRDLDQTVIGNPAHDIIRLALSLATASRGSDLPVVTTARILEQVIEGYRAALRQDADTIDDAPDSIQIAMGQSVARSWKLWPKNVWKTGSRRFRSARNSGRCPAPSARRLQACLQHRCCVICPRRCVRAMTTRR